MGNVRVQEDDFDAGVEIAALGQGKASGAAGAVASFIGQVRGHDEAGRPEQIAEVLLEHYPEMTEKALLGIVAEAETRWRLLDVCVIHRVGRLVPGDQIVFVGVASAHRGDAFSACEFIMDFLKSRAPFWKQETTCAGDKRWVEAKLSDEDALKRWDFVG